jgi:tetratricopeptide (TPR) repeat protein
MMPIRGAETACAARRCEQAIALLETAVRSEPGNYRLYYMLGVCYGGGCRRHSLASPDMAVSYLRQALRLVGCSQAYARAAILEELGNQMSCERKPSRQAALRAAMAYHTEAAALYETAGAPDDASRTNFNLGNTLCDLAEVTGEDHWREAVTRYEDALRTRSREQDPRRHAAVLENLGTAYRRLPGDHMKECFRCYRQALRIYVARQYPDQNAALQNNLGNAFLSLPGGEESRTVRNARRALRHFDRALEIQSANKVSRAWAITQYNRAQAYFRLARVSPVPNLRSALDCLQEAGAVFERCGEERYLQLVRAQLEEFRGLGGPK